MVTLESLVPADHLLRKIDAAVDFEFIRAQVGVIILLLQIDTVRLKKSFRSNELEIFRFVPHDPFFADWYAWPRCRPFEAGTRGQEPAASPPSIQFFS
ncbi:hypothetical protein [Cupriavidus metallidurans]